MGDIDALMTEISTAKASNDWETVDSKIDSFYDKITSCHIMEDAARQIKDISDFTTSSCIMKKIDSPEKSYITYEAGEELKAGQFFLPLSTGATTRVLNINDPEMALTNSDEDSHGPGFTKIVFNISEANNEEYSIELNFCNETSLQDEKLLLITYQIKNLLLSILAKYGEFYAKVTAYLQASSATDTFTVDNSMERNLEMAHSWNHQEADMKMTGLFNSSMTIKDDYLSIKSIDSHKSESASYGDNEGWNKRLSKVRFQASKSNDVKIFEGAIVEKATMKIKRTTLKTTIQNQLPLSINKTTALSIHPLKTQVFLQK